MREAPDEIPDGVDLLDIIPKIYEPIYNKEKVVDKMLNF